MDWRPLHHRIIVQIADFLTTVMGFVVSYYLWQLLRWSLIPYELGKEIILDSTMIFIVFFISIISIIILNIQGAYSYQRFTSFKKEVGRIFKTVCLSLLILFGIIFLLRPGHIPRTFVTILGVVNFILLIVEKLLLFKVAQLIRQKGYNQKTVLVAGTERESRKFLNAIEQNFKWGLNIKGFLTADSQYMGKEVFGKKPLGTFQDITTVLHKHPVDEVIITVSTQRLGEIRDIIEVCEREGVQVRIISDFLGKIAKRFQADMVYGLPIISVSYISKNEWTLAIKRVMDIVISLSVMVILFPFLLIIAVGIKLTSPGPLFYRNNVVGFNKKPFVTWKFRTMIKDADSLKEKLMHLNEMKGPVFKIKDDPRITRIGKFLRKYSLDELPQLWSVLKGDLSIVGPRAPGPHELKYFESWHRRKLSIKPGLTCIWQVNGRNEINKFDDWVKMDLEYIDNWSLSLDFKIILKTIPAVISGKGAS